MAVWLAILRSLMARRRSVPGRGHRPEAARVSGNGAFRQRFEAKGRLSHFVKKVPAKVVLRDDAALLGAAQVAMRMDAHAA